MAADGVSKAVTYCCSTGQSWGPAMLAGRWLNTASGLFGPQVQTDRDGMLLIQLLPQATCSYRLR